jgi:hypothetical protein
MHLCRAPSEINNNPGDAMGYRGNAKVIIGARSDVIESPLHRHARACRGHPRLSYRASASKAGMAGTSPISAKLSGCRAASPRPACGERSEFARSSRKFRVRGPLRESERVESLRPSPRPSPRKSGAREQKASGHLMLAPMGLVPAIHVLLAEARQERRGCPRQARA